MLSEGYEIEYGLYDHNNPTLEHPFQGQLMKEGEKLLSDSPMRELYKTYSIYQIHKWFGLNLLEFINLPAVRFDMLVDVANELAEEESKRLSESEQQMRQMTQGLKQQQNLRNDPFDIV
jgi:hypothetical protein